jgi:uncharacterized membrane protein SpoIIM required for sporulation
MIIKFVRIILQSSVSSAGKWAEDRPPLASGHLTLISHRSGERQEARVNINEFVAERKGEWEQLERIAGKFRPGSAAGLNREELWELGRLYIAAVSDLSILKSTEFGLDRDNPIITYLNALVVRVHGMIYRKHAFGWSSVTEFLFHGFPDAFRRNLIYVIISTSIFVGFGLIGFLLGLKEPGFIEILVPEQMISSVESGKVWFKDVYAVAPMASSHLMTHNISVTFLVVASGITFGMGTVYLLALNGLLIGTVAAMCMKHDLSLEFWSFVLPHGSLEISAIFIAGAAALIMGHALIDPGPYRRADYLSLRSKDAAKLALGCVPLLVMAGVIEAFFSPSPLPAWSKMVFAAASFSSLLLFLLRSGTRWAKTHQEDSNSVHEPDRPADPNFFHLFPDESSHS